MAVDLNNLVSQYLTPQVVGQIASATGVDPAAAQKLVAGAVPAVLASLVGAIGASGGAQKISDAVSNADPDLLAKLTGALGSGQTQTLTDGADALSKLIGGSGLWSLASALGQHAGVPHAAAQTAVGAVAQAAIGVIGQQDPSNWSDAGAISSLLAGQKSAIAAALPSGLSDLLGSSGLLASLSGAGAAAAKAEAKAEAAVSSAASSATSATPSASGSGFPTWAIVLIVIVVLAAIYWFMSHKKEEKPAASLAPTTIELAIRDGAWRRS